MEDNEIKTLLRKNLKLSKENNRLLKKMRRSAIIGNILRLIWWAVLLGLPIMLYYYFLQPYANQAVETYQGVQSGIKNIEKATEQLPSLPRFGDLFNFGGRE